MRPWGNDGRAAERQRGFALLVVLWALVLIALIAMHLAQTGRTEARIAANIRANAVAEAAADGAVHEAVFHLADSSDAHWEPDGAVHALRLGTATVKVRAESLDGRINPNRASPALLAALLRESGWQTGDAEAAAAAIVDWRSPPSADRSAEAKLLPYRLAGIDHGPPGEPFESLGELGRVVGMTPQLVARLRPHLSLYVDADPDPRRADPVVARAVQSVAEATPPPGPVGAAPPPARPVKRTVAIASDALGDEGGRFTRFGIVTIAPGLERGFAVLYWDRQPPD